MDSFEWNKIAGAVLFAALVGFGLSIASEMIFETEAPESPGYVIAVAEPTEGGEGGEPAAESQPIGVLLASADPAAGEAAAKKCATCHTFGNGEANKVGPNLWNVVNRPIASHAGYEYDEAMHEYAEQAQTWTFEHLNTFLHDPKGTVPGTKMAFAGLKNDAERGNVIAYLRSLSDSPAPLPEASAAPAEGEQQAAAAPAEGAQPEAPATPAPAEGAAPAPADQQAAAQTVAPAQQPDAPPAAATGEQAPAQGAEEQQAQAEAPAAQAPAAGEAPATTEAPAAGAPAAAGAGSAFASLVAAADPAKGENVAKRCAACHSFEKGAANKVGPNLWGIVDRPIATVPEFAYSEAMTAYSEGGSKTWTYDELSGYLENPKEHIPGNKMAFPGLRKEDDRANVVAYLRTLADTPAPLPAQ
jgi:cytochrome c2